MDQNSDVVKGIISTARENIKSGSLLPTFFVGKETPNEKPEIAIVGAPFESDEEKDMSAIVVKQIAKQLDANFIIFLSECWILKVENTTENLNLKPSLSPNREEVITISIETPEGQYVGMAPVIRNGDEVSFTEFDWKHSLEKSKGRFTNLLPQQERTLH